MVQGPSDDGFAPSNFCESLQLTLETITNQAFLKHCWYHDTYWWRLIAFGPWWKIYNPVFFLFILSKKIKS